MKILTKKQLEIIEPLKAMSPRFYEIQLMVMTGKESLYHNVAIREESSKIANGLTKKQIKECQRINAELSEYKKTLGYGLDMIKEGSRIVREMTQ